MNAVIVIVTAVGEIEIKGDTSAALPEKLHAGAVLKGALTLNVMVKLVAADKPVIWPLLDVEPVATLPAFEVGAAPANCKSPPADRVRIGASVFGVVPVVPGNAF